MLASRLSRCFLVLGFVTVFSGCLFVPKSSVYSLQTQHQAVVEQNHALTAELENLQIHGRNIEEQLARAEEDLALLDDRRNLDQKQLNAYAAEHDNLLGVLDGRSSIPPETRNRLAQISEEYSALKFDSTTGASKLDTDLLFDVGKAELKPGAEDVLRDLVRVLNSPQGSGLKILVVGHTDDRMVATKPVREKYPDNFHLSINRALVVSDKLRQLGLVDQRIGVAGFGAHQPVAPNMTSEDRRKNRRVELFVMAPTVPVIGWTESTPTLY